MPPDAVYALAGRGSVMSVVVGLDQEQPGQLELIPTRRIDPEVLVNIVVDGMPRVLPPHEHKVRAIPTLPTPEDLVAVWAPDLVRLVPVPRRHMQGLAETAWAKIAVGLGCCPLTAQGI